MIEPRIVWMWKIDDGETHWVAAVSKDRAVEVLNAHFEGDRQEDGELPLVELVPMMETIRVTPDAHFVDAKEIPPGGRVVIEATALQWTQMGEGLVASSVYP